MQQNEYKARYPAALAFLNEAADLRELFMECQNPALIAACLHQLGDVHQLLNSVLELQKEDLFVDANKMPGKKGRQCYTIEVQDGGTVFVCTDINYGDPELGTVIGWEFTAVDYTEYAKYNVFENAYTYENDKEKALKVGMAFAKYLLKNPEVRNCDWGAVIQFSEHGVV